MGLSKREQHHSAHGKREIRHNLHKNIVRMFSSERQVNIFICILSFTILLLFNKK